MARDFWMYQEREVKEPFAAHIWLFDSEYVNIRIYAEYVSSGAKNYMFIPIRLRDFFNVFEDFAEGNGWQLEAQDYDQIESLYQAITLDSQFLKG